MGAQFSGPFRQFLYSGGDNSLLYRLMDGGAAANEIGWRWSNPRIGYSVLIWRKSASR